VVEGLDELTIVSPDALAVVFPGVLRTLFLGAVFGTLIVDDEVQEGVVVGVEVASSPNGDAVHHEGADLGEEVVITETELEADTPVPVPLILLGPVEDGEGHFVPSDLVTLSRDEVATEERTAGAEIQGTVRCREANSRSGTLEHNSIYIFVFLGYFFPVWNKTHFFFLYMFEICLRGSKTFFSKHYSLFDD
jgi:hypothetical protein